MVAEGDVTNEGNFLVYTIHYYTLFQVKLQLFQNLLASIGKYIVGVLTIHHLCLMLQ